MGVGTVLDIVRRKKFTVFEYNIMLVANSTAASRQETDRVRVKREKDSDDDEIMTTPTPPAPNQPPFKIQRAQSSCLPSLNRRFIPLLDDYMHPYHDHEHHIRMPESRLVVVHDDDRMSIQQEAQHRLSVTGRENEDAESISTVVTIRRLPLSPLSDNGERLVEEREYALARTAEYQSALFEMLEDMCTIAARKYWQDVSSQGRHCLPSLGRDSYAAPSQGQYPQNRGGTQPIRTSRSNERFRTRHRVDPYPIRHGRSNDPGMRSHIWNFYGLSSYSRDGDPRPTASLSPPSSLEAQDRHRSPPLKFLELISRITNHIWRTERRHPVAPHRSAFLASRKCWDVWRCAEIVVRAVDGYDGFGDGSFEHYGGGVKCTEEVVRIVEAAGELCGMLGDGFARDQCEELLMRWEVERVGGELEEGEIVE